MSEKHCGARGIAQLCQILDLGDGGAESPPSERIRLALIDDGLPRRQTQAKIRNRSGRILARSDTGWARWRVLVEYHGEGHRQECRRTWDYEPLDLLDWRVVRVNSAQLRLRPHTIAARAAAKLREAGAPL
ncbi:hypothetical protein [Rhodococcus kronopolitis]|uniref:WYL domain-containing protein n=1 Tax=Rhodococcus kronopolitis TaxID=1460226 RepID=A0ABV9FNZ0_9NOCA